MRIGRPRPCLAQGPRRGGPGRLRRATASACALTSQIVAADESSFVRPRCTAAAKSAGASEAGAAQDRRGRLKNRCRQGGGHPPATNAKNQRAGHCSQPVGRRRGPGRRGPGVTSRRRRPARISREWRPRIPARTADRPITMCTTYAATALQFITSCCIGRASPPAKT